MAKWDYLFEGDKRLRDLERRFNTTNDLDDEIALWVARYRAKELEFTTRNVELYLHKASSVDKSIVSWIGTSQIAKYFNVSMPRAHARLMRLASGGLVERVPYIGIHKKDSHWKPSARL